MKQYSILILLAFFAMTTNAGILDWFRSKPRWWKKIDKKPLIEVFQPKGLRVSIADIDGLQVFDFHANLNEELYKNDNGTLSKTVLVPINGRWTYINPDIEIKEGDILHYWFYVKVNGEERWFARSMELIENVIPYPGSDLQFPSLIGPMCPCHTFYSEHNPTNQIYCDKDEFETMKKDLENSRIQINVLMETLLLLQKSDKNVPTLILTGKVTSGISPLDEIRRILVEKLKLGELSAQIRQAHYTDCGILFEMSSLYDKEQILAAAQRTTIAPGRKITEPENAECNTIDDNDNFEFIHARSLGESRLAHSRAINTGLKS